MVVEKFKVGCFDAVYERFHNSGRLLPPGLIYLDSWVNRNSRICFQLMETEDYSLFEVWFQYWSDLVEFEVYPVD